MEKDYFLLRDTLDEFKRVLKIQKSTQNMILEVLKVIMT